VIVAAAVVISIAPIMLRPVLIAAAIVASIVAAIVAPIIAAVRSDSSDSMCRPAPSNQISVDGKSMNAMPCSQQTCKAAGGRNEIASCQLAGM
jgi:hypothetical protein